jgi:hypothetical protein
MQIVNWFRPLNPCEKRESILKIENINYGRTERRHVGATAFILVGRDANQIGESGEGNPLFDAVRVFQRIA